MIKTRFSVVVLNCDNKGFIEPCIESILKNTPSELFDLIVVDQNSSDGSKEWLQTRISPANLILNPVNTGAWEGRNQGIRLGRRNNPDFFVFLDSDIEIRDAMWLHKLYASMIGGVGVAEAKVEIWDKSLMFAGFAVCMIKAEVFEEIGLFDRHFLIGGDVDFWVRFAWNGKYKIAFVEDTNIYHYCGRTINRKRIPAEDNPMHRHYRIEMIRYMYGDKFVKDTEGFICGLRLEEMKRKGWLK